MRLHALFTITVTAFIAVGLFYAQAEDAKSDPAKKPPTTKTSAPSTGSASTKRDVKSKPTISITPEREAAVLTFVQRNHAELSDLLAVLKTNQPDEYDRAVRDI